jgi:hypothetical protein
MPVNMTTWNPQGCLVSVIDDQAEAREAARALRDAGFGAEDVRLASSREITEIGAGRSRCGLLARLLTGLGSLGDEGIVGAAYLDEARRGHHLLIVHAPRPGRRRRAHAIATDHGAHRILYYGHWVITDQV